MQQRSAQNKKKKCRWRGGEEGARDLKKVRSNQPRTAAVRFSSAPPGNTESAGVLTVRRSSASLGVCAVTRAAAELAWLRGCRAFVGVSVWRSWAVEKGTEAWLLTKAATTHHLAPGWPIATFNLQ